MNPSRNRVPVVTPHSSQQSCGQLARARVPKVTRATPGGIQLGNNALGFEQGRVPALGIQVLPDAGRFGKFRSTMLAANMTNL